MKPELLTGNELNRIEISGRLTERKALRYTPAGLPVSEGMLQHSSEQMENGAVRQVNCEIPLLALGQNARWLQTAPVGETVRISGFLGARSRNSRTLVLHINTIEFLEGSKNGQILQEEG